MQAGTKQTKQQEKNLSVECLLILLDQHYNLHQ